MKIYKTSWGSTIDREIRSAIAQARDVNEDVAFDFNGVKVIVSSNSDPNLIYRDWHRGFVGCLGENPSVGQYPPAELTDAEKAADELVHAENERRRAASQAESNRQVALKRKELSDALQYAPVLDLRDATGWAEFIRVNQADPYSARVVRYAEEWGRLMQAFLMPQFTDAQVMSQLHNVAERCSRDANDDGITGFMYGCAVSALANCWKYGEQLRRWHNKDTQIGDEGDKANEAGGVLNPALLRVSHGK